MTPSEELGWKHGHPSALAIPPDLAVIAVVRSAEAWAMSMFAKPWHTVPQMQALDFSAFIRAPWETIIDRARYFGGPEAEPILGQPLQADRDPVTGQPHPNLFALRRAKLVGLTSYLGRECTVALIRMEAMQKAPEQILDSLLDQLGLPPRAGPLQTVTRRLGSKFKPAVADRPEAPAAFPDADRAFMTGELDLAQEAALGYRY